MGPWEQLIIQLIVMAKNMEGSLYYFWRKGTVKIWYLNELEYQNIEGFEFKDLKGNTANNYGQYQGSMSNHDKVYENVIEVLTMELFRRTL
jgi:hypothetical protein